MRRTSTVSRVTALSRIAKAAPSCCSIGTTDGVISYESQGEQSDVQETLPQTGFLILATFPREDHPDMQGNAMVVETVPERSALPARLRTLYFDWAPVPACGVAVFDLTTGEPVAYTVVRDVVVSGVHA